MSDEKSDVVGVHRHKNKWDNGLVYWRAQVQRNGVKTTLYYGLDKEAAERARLEYDRENPDFDPYSYENSKQHADMFKSKIFVDWPASILSWEKPTTRPLRRYTRSTVTHLYHPVKDVWRTIVKYV